MPNFKHDCSECRYLGEHRLSGGRAVVDLYHCDTGFFGGEIIVRRGNHNCECDSLPLDLVRAAFKEGKFARCNPLVVALHRVEEGNHE